MEINLKNFKPARDDVEYRYVASPGSFEMENCWTSLFTRFFFGCLGNNADRRRRIIISNCGNRARDKENEMSGIDRCCVSIRVLITQKMDSFLFYTPLRRCSEWICKFWDTEKNGFYESHEYAGESDESIGKALLGKVYQRLKFISGKVNQTKRI